MTTATTTTDPATVSPSEVTALHKRLCAAADLAGEARRALLAGAPFPRRTVEQALGEADQALRLAGPYLETLRPRRRSELRGYLVWGQDALKLALGAALDTHAAVALAQADRCLTKAEFTLSDLIAAGLPAIRHHEPSPLCPCAGCVERAQAAQAAAAAAPPFPDPDVPCDGDCAEAMRGGDCPHRPTKLAGGRP